MFVYGRIQTSIDKKIMGLTSIDKSQKYNVCAQYLLREANSFSGGEAASFEEQIKPNKGFCV